MEILGLKVVTAGANPTCVKKGIDLAVNEIVDKLHELSETVTTREQIAQVATISANGDKLIGEIIADAMDKVGKDGTITVEEAGGIESSLDVKEGMQFEQGYLSPHFVTNANTSECILDEPYILIANNKINRLADVLPLLQGIAKSGKPLVVIADTVEGEAFQSFVMNKMRGTLQCAVVKLPGFGDNKKELALDIAIATGAKVISDDPDSLLKNAQLIDLGKAKKIIINKSSTVIIEGNADDKQLIQRVDAIKNDIDNSDNDYDIQKYQERLAKLSGGVAVIYIGATTESEMKEKKARVEDALHATRAAIDEGIVPGGGSALIIANSNCIETFDVNTDSQYGIEIISKAISAPLKQICINADKAAEVVLNQVVANYHNTDGKLTGYDALNDKFVNMVEAGIIDPTKVTRTALQNAASIAGLLLTTAGISADIDKNEIEEINIPRPY